MPSAPPLAPAPGRNDPARGVRPSQHRYLSAPQQSRITDTDLVAALAAFAICVLGIWVTHGGLGDLTASASTAWTSIGALTGLLASATGLVGLVLAARPRSIEQHLGLDVMLNWHRRLGATMAVLVAVHVAASVAAYAIDLGGPWAAVRDLTGREPYTAGATIGAVLMGVVTISSIKAMRQRLSFETWYFVHLTAYLAWALSFGHTIVLGDLADDTLARWFWILVHVGVLGALLWCRWGRLAAACLRPLHVQSVEAAGPGTAAVQLTGASLRTMRAEPGQFFIVRPLTPSQWWQPHPFSLSAAPSTAGLRFTVKDRGDGTHDLLRLCPGTKVAVEGPYGITTANQLDGRKALFVAGGVGLTPVRSLLERLDPRAEPVVLLRARKVQDLAHLDEIQSLVAERGGPGPPASRRHRIARRHRSLRPRGAPAPHPRSRPARRPPVRARIAAARRPHRPQGRRPAHLRHPLRTALVVTL